MITRDVRLQKARDYTNLQDLDFLNVVVPLIHLAALMPDDSVHDLWRCGHLSLEHRRARKMSSGNIPTLLLQFFISNLSLDHLDAKRQA
jgi:hypothetical protein